MHLWCGIQIHLAGYTCKAPEVLVLQIATVAPAHYLHGYQVLARLQILSDVKLCSHLRVLRVAHVLAVHPHAQVAGGRTHVEVHLLTLPVLWQVECAAIRTRVVVHLAHVWRIVLKCGAPCITNILVYLVAIALHFEESWHWEVHPLRVVILQREETLRRILMILHKVEFPLTLHRQESLRSLLVALGLVFALKGKEVGSTRFTVLLVHSGVLPYRSLLCTGHGEYTTHHT